MYIDSDTHYIPIRWFERLGSKYPNCPRVLWENDMPKTVINGQVIKQYKTRGAWDLEARVADMDREGFDRHVLLPEQREFLYRWAQDLGCDLAKAYNDAVAEDLEACPHRDRFIPVAYVYFPDLNESIKELERAVKELGFRAVKMTAGPGKGVDLGSPTLWPFYEKAAELDIPLLVHGVARVFEDAASVNPALVGADQWAIQNVGDFRLLLGASFTYSAEMASLIFRGALDRFPTLRFCFLEGGAAHIPDLMDRFDRERESRKRLKKAPSKYFQQFYISATATERYLHHVTDAWKEHNLVTASDYPHKDVSGTHPNTISLIKENKRLSGVDKEKILGSNAERLFGLIRG